MTTTNTNDLRIKNARDFRNSFEDEDGNSLGYLFVGRVQPWPDENAPPVPQNNLQEFNTVYDNLFSMRSIRKDLDTFFMIPRVNWVSGVTYDYYRQDYSSVNKSFSGASNLYDCVWIVRNVQNNVYICLNNNKNTPSTVEPLNTSDEPFLTSDGYQWQRIFNYTSGVYFGHSTDNFMPIQENDVVVTEAGALSTVIIENAGGGYNNNPIGAPNQLPFCYCGIDGDGTGAVAKVSISNSNVQEIEVVRSGSGYTFGTLNFTPNNCYESLPDYDRSENPLNFGGDGTFRSTVIIPPTGGWGTDLQRELGGTRLGVFSNFSYQLFKYIKASFRQIGILQDMELTKTSQAFDSGINACYAVGLLNVERGTSYISGETIQQTVTDSNGDKRLAKGVVISFTTGEFGDTGVLRYSQNSTTVDEDGNLYRFSGDNAVIGETSNVAGTPRIGYNASETDITFNNGYADPEVIAYTGTMTYLANISPIVRDVNQSERITLIISF